LNKEMLKGTIDLFILAVLNQGDSYGYKISKAIKEQTAGTLKLQEATLYLALKRLEGQNAIKSYEGEVSHGGKRKYYAMTPLGEALLQRYILDWKQMAKAVDHFV
jgi:PadR family transcriptional regulator, regulatory protein PadR